MRTSSSRLFLNDRRGFTGAEKALLVVFGLALVVIAGVPVRQGSSGSKVIGFEQRSAAGLARLSQQARGLKDAVGEQKLGFLGRESAQGIGDNLKADFLEGLNRRAADPANAGKSLHQLIQDEVAANPGKYALKGDLVPLAELQKQGPFSRVLGLESVFKFHLTDAAKARFTEQGITTAEAFAEAVRKDPKIFDVSTQLNKDSLISGKNGVAWWSPRGQSKAGTLPELVDELALNPAYYKGGAVRITVDPEAAGRLGFRKPTTFDGAPFAEWAEAPPRSPIGQTAGGTPEAVAPSIRLGDSTVEVFY